MSAEKTSPNIHRLRIGETDTSAITGCVERMLGWRPIAMIPFETQAPRFVWQALFDDHDTVLIKAEETPEAKPEEMELVMRIDRALRISKVEQSDGSRRATNDPRFAPMHHIGADIGLGKV